MGSIFFAIGFLEMLVCLFVSFLWSLCRPHFSYLPLVVSCALLAVADVAFVQLLPLNSGPFALWAGAGAATMAALFFSWVYGVPRRVSRFCMKGLRDAILVAVFLFLAVIVVLCSPLAGFSELEEERDDDLF